MILFYYNSQNNSPISHLLMSVELYFRLINNRLMICCRPTMLLLLFLPFYQLQYSSTCGATIESRIDILFYSGNVYNSENQQEPLGGRRRVRVSNYQFYDSKIIGNYSYQLTRIVEIILEDTVYSPRRCRGE